MRFNVYVFICCANKIVIGCDVVIMNLLKKRKLKKDIKEMKATNNQMKDFLDSLAEKYDVKETDILSDCKLHLDNINLVFDSMLSGLENK